MGDKRWIKIPTISNYASRELYYYCLQYTEKKIRIINNIASDKDKLNIRLIEDTIKEVIKDDEYLYDYILKNVTMKYYPYGAMNPPCNRHKFYDKRRKFYERLYYNRELRIR